MNDRDPRLILASTSPRRAEILTEAGFEFDMRAPGIDDAQLTMPTGGDPAQWVAGLAHLKAASLGISPTREHVVVLGADTVVVKDGQVIGQPRSLAQARQILDRLENGAHRVLSGVALLAPQSRSMLVDSASVRVGAIGSHSVSRYLESGNWRGKAGAYNLAERLADGWPITFEGDATTIMGLPMTKLLPILARLGIRPRTPNRGDPA